MLLLNSEIIALAHFVYHLVIQIPSHHLLVVAVVEVSSSVPASFANNDSNPVLVVGCSNIPPFLGTTTCLEN